MTQHTTVRNNITQTSIQCLTVTCSIIPPKNCIVQNTRANSYNMEAPYMQT